MTFVIIPNVLNILSLIIIVDIVFINAHVYFSKNNESQQKGIFVIDVNAAMNSTGNKAILINSIL